MKYILIILLLLKHTAGFSQAAKRLTPQKPSDALEKILIKKIYDFTNAWASSDTVLLNSLLAPEYRHSDVFGALQHKKDWLIFAAAKRAVTEVELSDLETLIYDKDLAVITGKISYLFGPEKLKQVLRFTQLWKNDSNHWRRVSFQGTYVK